MYTDCDGLMTKSGSSEPKTSVMEIANAGVDLNKIVIGKPGEASDADNGFIDPSQLANCVQQGKAKGWAGGSAFHSILHYLSSSLILMYIAVMSWEYPHADTKWITSARGSAFPL